MIYSKENYVTNLDVFIELYKMILNTNTVINNSDVHEEKEENKNQINYCDWIYVDLSIAYAWSNLSQFVFLESGI